MSGRAAAEVSTQYDGGDADGGYAEYATVPAAFAHRLPAAFADPGTAVLLRDLKAGRFDGAAVLVGTPDP